MLARLEKYGPINSHDALKALALIIMTIDHVGAYLLTDALWWRAIGRVTFPVWFFLVGYARGGRISPELLGFALLLMLGNALTSVAFFPVNALVSIILCRLAVNAAQSRGWISQYPGECIAACIALHVLSAPLFEYGTMAIGFALAGRMVREGMHGGKLAGIWIVLTGFFILTQQLAFAFSHLQLSLVVVGTVLCCRYCYRFRLHPITLPAWLRWPVCVASRYSLEYYVLHRLAFQAIGAFVLGAWPLGFVWMAAG